MSNAVDIIGLGPLARFELLLALVVVDAIDVVALDSNIATLSADDDGDEDKGADMLVLDVTVIDVVVDAVVVVDTVVVADVGNVVVVDAFIAVFVLCVIGVVVVGGSCVTIGVDDVTMVVLDDDDDSGDVARTVNERSLNTELVRGLLFALCTFSASNAANSPLAIFMNKSIQ